jgi:hypothetical protein
MSPPRRDPKTARITEFSRDRLDDLVARMATTKPVMPVSDWDLVGGLVWAALRSPPEIVKASVSAYRDLQLEIDAAEAVGAFFRYFAR